MDLELTKLLLESYTSDLYTKLGVNPYSREFVFGSSEIFTRARNTPLFLDQTGHTTVLNNMLRYGLTDALTQQLFPSPFDLGSKKNIPEASRTLLYLATKIHRDNNRLHQTDKHYKRLSDDPAILKKKFETITVALKEITGITFRAYPDKQNSLRVVNLFAMLMADPKTSREGRGRRLLSFIKIPTERYSFETRSANPVAGNESNTFLLSELKSYLGIELDHEVLRKIDYFFYQIFDRVDNIRATVEKAALKSKNRFLISATYRDVLTALWSFEKPIQASHQNASRRLDLDLYLHISKIDYLNFAGAYLAVRKIIKPKTPITPIPQAITVALSKIKRKNLDHFHTTLNDFKLTIVSDLLKLHGELFLDLIEKSMGFRPSISVFKRSIPMTSELLYRSRVFSERILIERESVQVSFLAILAALCTCNESLHKPTQLRAHVVGDDSQSRSIVTMLEKEININEILQKGEPASEEYFQLWHNRFEWVRYSLEGNTYISELMFLFRTELQSRVAELVTMNGVDQIDEGLCSMEKLLLSAAVGRSEGLV